MSLPMHRKIKFVSFLIWYLCLGHPLVGVCHFTKKAQESVSVAILHLEASRIAHRSRTATQKPTPVYAINASGCISPEISCRKQDNHISTGIYRCSIPDFDVKFCENFKVSGISADSALYVLYERDSTRIPTSRSTYPIPGIGSVVSLPLLAWSAMRPATAKVIFNFVMHKLRIVPFFLD